MPNDVTRVSLASGGAESRHIFQERLRIIKVLSVATHELHDLSQL